jgi:hypothetical protein
MQARTDKHTGKKFQKLKKWFAFFNIKKLKKQAKLNDSDESDIEIFPLSPRGDHGKDVSIVGTLPSISNSSTSSDEQSSTFSDLDQAEGLPMKLEVPGLVLIKHKEEHCGTLGKMNLFKKIKEIKFEEVDEGNSKEEKISPADNDYAAVTPHTPATPTTPSTPTPGSSESAKIKIKIGKGEMG